MDVRSEAQKAVVYKLGDQQHRPALHLVFVWLQHQLPLPVL